MRARSGAMLTVSLLLLLPGALAFEYLKIISFSAPTIVYPFTNEIELRCAYKGNITLLSLFRGSNEFFRYNPTLPETHKYRVFPGVGIRNVDVLDCKDEICCVKVGVTHNASGNYRCDIELSIPPYDFDSKTTIVEYKHVKRNPEVAGLKVVYMCGDLVVLHCRAEGEADIRWYVNDFEVVKSRGQSVLQFLTNDTNFVKTDDSELIVQCSDHSDNDAMYSQPLTAVLVSKEYAFAFANKTSTHISAGVNSKNLSRFILPSPYFAILLNYILKDSL